MSEQMSAVGQTLIPTYLAEHSRPADPEGSPHSTDAQAVARAVGRREKLMTTLRSDINPNEQTAHGPTSFMTELDEHEVRCGMCARAVDVNEETYRFVSEAIESGLDNPFRCEICAEEYDDLVYEG